MYVCMYELIYFYITFINRFVDSYSPLFTRSYIPSLNSPRAPPSFSTPLHISPSPHTMPRPGLHALLERLFTSIGHDRDAGVLLDRLVVDESRASPRFAALVRLVAGADRISSDLTPVFCSDCAITQSPSFMCRRIAIVTAKGTESVSVLAELVLGVWAIFILATRNRIAWVCDPTWDRMSRALARNLAEAILYLRPAHPPRTPEPPPPVCVRSDA